MHKVQLTLLFQLLAFAVHMVLAKHCLTKSYQESISDICRSKRALTINLQIPSSNGQSINLIGNIDITKVKYPFQKSSTLLQSIREAILDCTNNREICQTSLSKDTKEVTYYMKTTNGLMVVDGVYVKEDARENTNRQVRINIVLPIRKRGRKSVDSKFEIKVTFGDDIKRGKIFGIITSDTIHIDADGNKKVIKGKVHKPSADELQNIKTYGTDKKEIKKVQRRSTKQQQQTLITTNTIKHLIEEALNTASEHMKKVKHL